MSVLRAICTRATKYCTALFGTKEDSLVQKWCETKSSQDVRAKFTPGSMQVSLVQSEINFLQLLPFARERKTNPISATIHSHSEVILNGEILEKSSNFPPVPPVPPHYFLSAAFTDHILPPAASPPIARGGTTAAETRLDRFPFSGRGCVIDQ